MRVQVIRVDTFEPVTIPGPQMRGAGERVAMVRTGGDITIVEDKRGGYIVMREGQREHTRIGPANVKQAFEVVIEEQQQGVKR